MSKSSIHKAYEKALYKNPPVEFIQEQLLSGKLPIDVYNELIKHTDAPSILGQEKINNLQLFVENNKDIIYNMSKKNRVEYSETPSISQAPKVEGITAKPTPLNLQSTNPKDANVQNYDSNSPNLKEYGQNTTTPPLKATDKTSPINETTGKPMSQTLLGDKILGINLTGENIAIGMLIGLAIIVVISK